jgi:hypothetical protein
MGALGAALQTGQLPGTHSHASHTHTHTHARTHPPTHTHTQHPTPLYAGLQVADGSAGCRAANGAAAGGDVWAVNARPLGRRLPHRDPGVGGQGSGAGEAGGRRRRDAGVGGVVISETRIRESAPLVSDWLRCAVSDGLKSRALVACLTRQVPQSLTVRVRNVNCSLHEQSGRRDASQSLGAHCAMRNGSITDVATLDSRARRACTARSSAAFPSIRMPFRWISLDSSRSRLCIVSSRLHAQSEAGRIVTQIIG